MTTGEALMLRAWTVGVAVAGRFALAMASSIAAVVALTSVPNENWATTSEIELDDVDWMVTRRGMPLMAFSIGLRHLFGDVGRPGTRERRHDRDDREIDVGQKLLLQAAPRRETGDEQGAGEQERDAPLAEGDPAEATHGRCLPLVTVGGGA